MIGQTVLHYKILEKLGEGGMGVVYRAEDTDLKRDVAIKFLPRQIAASDEERERFKIEAQAAAALNHANIATIYSIEKTDDETFIVMEYIKGQELKDRIDAGPLPIDDALNIAIQIAKGLQAAHAKDVIHRDIKSANIMLTDKGDVKIMDFGLAKRGGQTKLTKEGTTLGTVAYMSPEQTRGEDVDQRSDIFSLGVLLYEMVTGQLPFKGDYDQAIIYSILNEDPEPLTGLRTGMPMELERIVGKCLKKAVWERYQRVDELIVDLKTLRTKSSTGTHAHVRPTSRNKNALYPGVAVLIVVLVVLGFYIFNQGDAINSIAVLPFVNASGNADGEYLSDGMTETLISSLSRLPNIGVKSRSAVFRYKDAETSPQTIGKELNVQAVLSGRIVQRGEQVILSLELVNVRNENVIWSDQYNRKQTDIVALQSEIARDVSSKLKTKLSGEDIAEITKTYTADPEAYELYLKGKFHANKFTEEGLRRSIDAFNQAIAIDPDYSSAYSGLAYSTILLNDWFVSPHQSAPDAREAAKKALTINEADVDAHVVLGIVAHWYDWDWAAAEREFKRSIELNPRNPESCVYYAWFLSPMQRHEEALAMSRQALQIDPLSSLTNHSVCSSLIFSHSWDAAIAQLGKAIQLDPNYWFHHSNLGRAYEQKGMMSEAIAEFELALELDSLQAENWAALGHALAVTGKKAEARKMINDLLKLSQDGMYVAAYNVAVIYVGLRDEEQAFAWLERAYSDRSYYLSGLTIDARLDGLHANPRFKDLVRRIGLPE